MFGAPPQIKISGYANVFAAFLLLTMQEIKDFARNS